MRVSVVSNAFTPVLLYHVSYIRIVYSQYLVLLMLMTYARQWWRLPPETVRSSDQLLKKIARKKGYLDLFGNAISILISISISIWPSFSLFWKYFLLVASVLPGRCIRVCMLVDAQNAMIQQIYIYAWYDVRQQTTDCSRRVAVCLLMLIVSWKCVQQQCMALCLNNESRYHCKQQQVNIPPARAQQEDHKAQGAQVPGHHACRGFLHNILYTLSIHCCIHDLVFILLLVPHATIYSHPTFHFPVLCNFTVYSAYCITMYLYLCRGFVATELLSLQ